MINSAKQLADEKGIASAVMTFTPHPSVVLGRNVQHIDMITPLQKTLDASRLKQQNKLLHSVFVRRNEALSIRSSAIAKKIL